MAFVSHEWSLVEPDGAGHVESEAMPSEVIAALIERYGRYLQLLRAVGAAVRDRSEEAVVQLEADCAAILQDIQGGWTLLETYLYAADSGRVVLTPELAYLRSVMEAVQVEHGVSQAALAQWAAESGGESRTVESGTRALRGYGGLTDGESVSFSY
jgi:hypothetical protein